MVRAMLTARIVIVIVIAMVVQVAGAFVPSLHETPSAQRASKLRTQHRRPRVLPQLRMAEAEPQRHARSRLLGSRRLRHIRETLKDGPESVDASTGKLLGSRRLAFVASTLVRGKPAHEVNSEATVKSSAEHDEANVKTSAAAGHTVSPASLPDSETPGTQSVMSDSVEQSIEIDASPDVCYQVAAKLEDYPKWVASLESVEVLAAGREGLAKQAKFAVGAFGKTLDYTLEYTHEVPRRLSWKAIAGSVKALVGSYTFDAIDGGKRTRVTYKLALDPGFSIPSMIKKASTKLIVGTALSDLRKYTEKPDTQERVQKLIEAKGAQGASASAVADARKEEEPVMSDSVEQSIEIDASPDVCYQVAAKLEDYPKWVASLESVEVLAAGREGLAKQAKFAVGAFGKTLDYTLEYTHEVPRRLSWKAIAGSVKALVGSYTFDAIDGGKRTRVTYKLALDPGFSIPSMIKKASTKLIVGTALSDLRKYTEKPDTQERVQKLIEAKGAQGASASAVADARKEEEPVMSDSVEQSIEIDASPDVCYQVAAKLEDYPKWVASLESVEVLAAGREGLAKQAKFAVGAFGKTLDYTLEYTHEVPRRLSWKAIAGSVKALVGSYTFDAIDGGKRTRVTYKLALDPGFSIPSMIKKASTKLIVGTALSDLRKYTEKPDTQERVQKLIEAKGAQGASASAVADARKEEEPVMSDSVEQSIEIDASPDVCYQVAAKLEDYPKWVASLESVEVLAAGREGLAKQAKFAVGAFGKTLDYTLEYTHEVPRRLSWKAIAGSVKALVGSYTFDAIDGGKRTRVTYKLALDPGFSIPSMIKKASTKLIVGTALSDLRKYTEKPDTQERVQKLIEAKGAQGASASAVADARKEEEPVMSDSVEQSIEIDASPDVCYQVAAKLEDYPKWVASLESVEVLAAGREGLAKQAKFAVGAFGKTLDYTLEYTHEVPRRLSWKAIAGSVKALVGSYTFDAIDGGKRTRVTYKLALDPGFSIPSMIKKASTKLIVGTALSDLRKYTEKPDTQERVQKLIEAKGAQGASASAVADARKEEEPVMSDSVEQSIEIDASPDVCYQVAAKLEDYPKWVASLESVEVLAAGREGLAKQAKFAVGAFGKTLDYTLEYTHEVPRRLSWKAIAGSVKALVGSYTFDAIDGGKRTRVTYKLALDPGFSIPSMIKKASTKLIVGTALSDLRKYTEKPDTQERVQKLIEAKGAQGASASAVADARKEEEPVMSDSVEQSIEIDASPDVCYQVAAKLEDYPKWVASLESVEVLAAGREGLAKQAKFAVGAFGKTLDYTLEYTHEVPRRLSWKAIAGSVKALVGSYTFDAIDGGKRTRVTYKLALDPGFSIPSMIKKASTKLIVGTALSDLRKYTEKQERFKGN
jgi:uncharacterized membrane protein